MEWKRKLMVAFWMWLLSMVAVVTYAVITSPLLSGT